MAQMSESMDVPNMGRRQFMNFLTFGTVTGTALGALYPVVKFFIPPSSASTSGGVTAKDELGNDVSVAKFLETHNVGDRALAQGFRGDPTYIVVESKEAIADYGINAVCTHLGCVVPWNTAENKFKCPCHGSQYDNTGKVVRGPAPLSLPLVHAKTEEDKVIFTSWTETDFRTGEPPWWT
jgi:cytochrome b6-f complex iron-sulfur subunit